MLLICESVQNWPLPRKQAYQWTDSQGDLIVFGGVAFDGCSGKGKAALRALSSLFTVSLQSLRQMICGNFKLLPTPGFQCFH